LVKVEGQRVVDLDRRKMRMRPPVFEAEDTGEKLGRGDLVAGRDDRVIEDDRHRNLQIGTASDGGANAAGQGIANSAFAEAACAAGSRAAKWETKPLKFGIVSDIHCNAAGLGRALELMGDVDELICLGDSIWEYRFSNEVAALLKDRGAHTILGNHEEVFF